MFRVTSSRVAIFVGLALALAGCGSAGSSYGGSGGGACPVGATVVTVGAGGLLDFSPADVSVKVGDTVCWLWATSGHDVTSGSGCVPDGAFGTGHLLAAGQTYSFTFDTAGTYPYFCSIHCSSGMTGTVTVGP